MVGRIRTPGQTWGKHDSATKRPRKKPEDLIFIKAKEGRCVQGGDCDQQFPVIQKGLEKMCTVSRAWS